ncbi:hypothetical protein [Chitinophaga pinensis]|nr:hypothetical protein [Chitinophaga pinensis]
MSGTGHSGYPVSTDDTCRIKQKSVSFAGQQWDQRFDRLLSMLPVVM